MIKKVILSLSVLCFGLFAFTMSASAHTVCDGVSVTEVGTSILTDSGVYVIFQNDSGAACGNLANGAEQKYFLTDDAGVDRTYVAIITAMTFDKQMKVKIAGTAGANSLVMWVGIKNP